MCNCFLKLNLDEVKSKVFNTKGAALKFAGPKRSVHVWQKSEDFWVVDYWGDDDKREE